MTDALLALERRGVITRDPKEANECCGLPRDDDGFCIHRPGHPIYVEQITSMIPTTRENTE